MIRTARSRIVMIGILASCFGISYASTPLTAEQIKNIHSPFSYNVGIDFDTMLAPKVNAKTVIKNVSTNIKLFRVYRLCASGSDCNVIDTPTQALADQMQQDPSIEAVIGTLNVMPISADAWVQKLKATFGSSINQIKVILIGNEVNANNITADELSNRIQAMAQALKDNGLPNISVSTSFNGLPRIGTDKNANALFDPYMQAIVNNWSSNWNNGYPFVEFDPYADALLTPDQQKDPANIIGAANKVFSEYYADVYNNYVSRFKTVGGNGLQVFIGETGAEGIKDSDDPTDGSKVNSAITDALNDQYSLTAGYTIPTFLFEVVNEPGKADGQRQMGFFTDDGGSNGSSIPGWIANKKPAPTATE
ncbi:hypothetical protein [Cysteiniphilum sp. JM-1]|uniref:hypothetical protein n=1 Tax=Cysteiniphilum sp. JM-1 TaxID=2610891 RepID=UPI0012450C1B|nr:hypothetical protein [Cysteiniphilum sp. JM-1]